MAKYTVKCEECGKDYGITLYGKMSKREYQLENNSWVCEQCKISETVEKAKGSDLEGTPKQIVWAESIRKKILSEEEDLLDMALEEHKEAIRNILKKIKSNKKSSYWIDNRYCDLETMITEEYAKNKKKPTTASLGREAVNETNRYLHIYKRRMK